MLILRSFRTKLPLNVFISHQKTARFLWSIHLTHRNEFRSFGTQQKQTNFNEKTHQKYLFTATITTLGTIVAYYYGKRYIFAKEPVVSDNIDSKFGSEIPGLKTYTLKDVSKHNDKTNRVWVSFKSGVYDITDFIDKHPGGDAILMGAGGSLGPFWMLYAVHKNERVLKMLEEYRIGNLSADDREVTNDINDPFSNDPLRQPTLKPSSVKPFNAEPPLQLLVESFITPNDLFYVRNHLPVPNIDPKEYTLEIDGFGMKSEKTLTLNDIKTKFTKHTITAAIQCGGNRRSEMSEVKEVESLSWGAAAISNAQWSGARLIDVLKYCDLDFSDNRIKHVQFEGYDFDAASNPYGASVTADVALDPKRDLLIAYEMNGEEIPRDHGFPVRLIAPGIIGARNVKWLNRIVLSDEESDSFYQRRDNKVFSPNVDWDNVDFDKAQSIQEIPIQSAICDPRDGQMVKVNADGFVKVRGYAFSGGGKKIIRIDVSPDNGKNWFTANLNQESSHSNRTWSWSLWDVNVPVSKGWKRGDRIELICKAIDSNYNTQPESFASIWNFRGLLCNAWHRVSVILQ